MTVFKICFWSACLILFFSCKEKNELDVRTPGPSNKRLLGIKKVKRVIPNNSFMYYNSDNVPFFELTIQNISNFELDYHYPKRLPFWAGPCMEYLDFPSTAGCLFIEDTSRVIKKNEEFIIRINPLDYNSQFHKYEYQGFKFQLLISSSSDLSFYFEGNHSKPKYKKIILEDNNGGQIYGYPLEFIYWTSTGFFWEHYLLE